MDKLKELLMKFWPHLAVVAGFYAIALFYFAPAMKDMKLAGHDMEQTQFMRAEVDKYHEIDGKYPAWTNGLFGGMPTNMISGIPNKNYVYRYNPIMLPFGTSGSPFHMLIMAMAGMYILLICLGTNRWLAAAGAIGYAFATFSITSIAAGHVTKVLAMGVAPAILGGLYLLWQKKWLQGLFLVAFFFSLQTAYFHYQITYYTLLSMGIFGLFALVSLIREKDMKAAALFTALSVAGIGMGLLSNYGKLTDTAAIAKYTTRGGSALDQPGNTAGKNQNASIAKGLDIDYAFQWSYGIGETFTTIIPGYAGGSNREKLSENSALVKNLTDGGVPEEDAVNIATQGAPVYHGELPFTSGPVYIGAVFFLLFVLGIIVSKGPLKWAMITLTIVFTVMAWGKHLMFINELLFNLLPFYNKFRTPMMSFSMVQIALPALGIYGLHLWLTGKASAEEKWKQLKLAGMIAGGAVLAFGIVFSAFYDFSSAGDKQMDPRLISALKDQRASMLRGDAFRSLMLMGLVFASMYYYMKQKISVKLVYVVLIGACAFDLIGVGYRYLDKSNFTEVAEEQPATRADEQVMNDKDPHKRVLDLRVDPFNDNSGGRFHHMIGGYHPAKLSLYQDFISSMITSGQQQFNDSNIRFNRGLDLLNCRYVIFGFQSGGDTALSRPSAMGNAWFVDELVSAPNPKSEIESLKQIDIRRQATAVKTAKTFTPDTTASIRLTHYHPDTMVYRYTRSTPGFAVFSEVYYPETWKAYVDGKETPYTQVDFLLRGMEVPGDGKEHEIRFICSPKSYAKQNSVEMASSLAIYGLLAVILVGVFRRKEENQS